ncbi:TatD family deoxyribonuclease [Clostridium botulinum]|uniref:TatD family deoxyribonuclease n=1 Tax=Clostridium botulinum TaxID=1491 RepID=A0A6G4HUJ2_CLOBO|nr:TatD family hydrolase [Clostridium botulinum]MBD5588468.1 TatD family hydrolase [Clostridium botulinum]MBO0570672.1 TatD family deoxyribonuclease [Clostridium botulinum]MBO0581871.1 TatD family deoxyribonuclease [Clostridium botulinum]NFJ62646.1 TatD family deoxyribonuclease [Clostridium botulinum]NFJ69926.1 TatD family deoxyribonuclease [Clostridium botulinum]
MKKYRIFDAHAHYDDEAFDEDRSEVIKELEDFGILGVLNCGSSLDTSKTSVELSNKYNFFYAAVGVHPENAEEINEKTLNKIEALSENEKVKAIGEIGLDYYYEENPKRDIQIKAFKKQMELAKKLNLPVVIHDRDAHKDTLDIIKQFPNVKGEVHCFSGSVEFAKQCVDLGYYIGVTGVVTFKNAKKIVEVIKSVPMDRILVETDCPYMAPTPLRGKRNRSEYIKYMIDKIAEIKEISSEEVTSQILINIKDLFNIDVIKNKD